MKYLSDEELIKKIRQGDSECMDLLITKYKTLVKIKARAYYIIGAETEDIIQEGMIGLYKAIRDYMPDKEASFKSFADICITRQIYTAIKTSTRQKHIPLNSSVSGVLKGISDPEIVYAETLIHLNESNPENHVINKENKVLTDKLLKDNLSKLEFDVLMLYLSGKSYIEMADVIGKNIKTIDNALQRVKKKLDGIFKAKMLD